MTDKLPEVSEILPAGAACAQWLQEGDNARAVPFVAFAAGWHARDVEIAASEAARAVLVEALREAVKFIEDDWFDNDEESEFLVRARALLARADGGEMIGGH